MMMASIQLFGLRSSSMIRERGPSQGSHVTPSSDTGRRWGDGTPAIHTPSNIPVIAARASESSMAGDSRHLCALAGATGAGVADVLA